MSCTLSCTVNFPVTRHNHEDDVRHHDDHHVNERGKQLLDAAYRLLADPAFGQDERAALLNLMLEVEKGHEQAVKNTFDAVRKRRDVMLGLLSRMAKDNGSAAEELTRGKDTHNRQLREMQAVFQNAKSEYHSMAATLEGTKRAAVTMEDKLRRMNATRATLEQDVEQAARTNERLLCASETLKTENDVLNKRCAALKKEASSTTADAERHRRARDQQSQEVERTNAAAAAAAAAVESAASSVRERKTLIDRLAQQASVLEARENDARRRLQSLRQQHLQQRTCSQMHLQAQERRDVAAATLYAVLKESEESERRAKDARATCNLRRWYLESRIELTKKVIDRLHRAADEYVRKEAQAAFVVYLRARSLKAREERADVLWHRLEECSHDVRALRRSVDLGESECQHQCLRIVSTAST